uniref:DnaJ homolog subfamily C member 2 n=1 Tax=Rhabditophanes sp. KR3021 TaxID=114890 RepID=A0AC35TNG0_9BILA
MAIKQEDCLVVALWGCNIVERSVEEAGICYETSLIRDKLVLRKCTLPVYRQPQSSSGESSDTEEDVDVDNSALFDEDTAAYRKMLIRLEPADWKEFDHYKILGLSKLRYKANATDIKNAYRKKVLIYHPDKSKQKSALTKGQMELAFGCIQKSYELLGDTIEKRHSYDSVDPEFNDSIPSEKSINAENIFRTLGPVFEMNARFSKKQPVPLFGDANSTRAFVEDFYDFWIHFESWREFSYLDEEDSSKGEDRWERREIDKGNKSKRDKLRKDDQKRVTGLIEMAHNKDPRLSVFKEEDKKNKLNEKERKKKELARKREEEKLRFEQECIEYKRKEEEKKKAEIEAKKKAAADKIHQEEAIKNEHVWSKEEIELLVKATRLYPPGTSERWQQIADYINSHKKDKSFTKTTKAVIKYIRDKSTIGIANGCGIENKAPLKGEENGTEEVDEEWTATEQKDFETAIKANKTNKDDDKWDKIAAAVGTKSKKECIKRFKELVAKIKAKRAAEE